MKSFRWDKKYLYWGMTAFCVIIACIVFFMAIQQWAQLKETISLLLRVLNPMIWGLVLAYLLNPLLRTLEKRVFGPLMSRFIKKNAKKSQKAVRALSVLFSVLIMGAIVMFLLWLVLPQLYTSIQSIVMNLTEYSRNLMGWIETLFAGSVEMEEIAASVLTEVTDSFSNWLRGSLLPQMGDIVSYVTGGVFILVKGIMNIFIGVIIACYLLYNKENFTAQTKKLLFAMTRPRWAMNLIRASRFMDDAFTGFISGKLLDSLIVGVICYAATMLLGMPYAVLVSVIVGVTNIIPFFGPFIGAIPSAIIILMVSPIKCLIFVIFIIVLQQVDGNIIGPKILGSTTGLNGFWVMFAILMGSGLFGFVGLLCGVPVFTALYAGAKSLVAARLKKRGFPSETARYMDVEEIVGGLSPEEAGAVPESAEPATETESGGASDEAEETSEGR